MVYRKPHLDCIHTNCQSYSSYIRVQKKWIKSGEYNSKCKTFTPAKDVKTYSQIKEASLAKLFREKIPYFERLLGIKSNM